LASSPADAWAALRPAPPVRNAIRRGTQTGGAGQFSAQTTLRDRFDPDSRLQENNMTQTTAIKLLNAASTTGDGPVFNLEFPQMAAAVQAEIAGAPTQAVINVMALLDGGTWDTLCVLDTSQGYVSGEISPIAFPVPIRQVKGNITTLTGGTNPSVSLYFTARG
jgi:hypothetical protein